MNWVVYIVRIGDAVKIGRTRKLKARVASIQADHPTELTIVKVVENTPVQYEAWLHGQFRAEHIRGEWFKATENLLAVVTALPDRLPDGYTVLPASLPDPPIEIVPPSPRLQHIPQPTKRQPALSMDEWRRLYKAAKASTLRDYALIRLMYEAGLRASEVGKLTLERCRPLRSQRLIYIERSKHSQSGWFELQPGTVEVLLEWIRSVYPTHEVRRALAPLFPGQSGVGLSRFGVFRIVRRLCSSADLPLRAAHPHVIRHSRVMHIVHAAIAKGIPLELIVPAVAKIVGHASAWTTINNYISETRGVKKHVAEVTVDLLSDESPRKQRRRRRPSATSPTRR